MPVDLSMALPGASHWNRKPDKSLIEQARLLSMPGSTARPFGGGLTARWWLGNAANIMYRSHD